MNRVILIFLTIGSFIILIGLGIFSYKAKIESQKDTEKILKKARKSKELIKAVRDEAETLGIDTSGLTLSQLKQAIIDKQTDAELENIPDKITGSD